MKSIAIIITLIVLSCAKAEPPIEGVDLNSGEPPEVILKKAIETFERVRDRGIRSEIDQIELCVKIGTVIAAAIQAEDQEAFSKWSAISEEMCKEE